MVRVFLGSSMESMDTMNRIAVWVQESGHQAVRWSDPGTFPPGQQTFETLLEISQRVEGAIFVFAEDDKLWYRGSSVLQPRDNVLLEYGLFSGVLGPRQSIICRVGAAKVAGDLAGLTAIQFDPQRTARPELEVRQWLQSLAEPGIERGAPWIFKGSEHERFFAYFRERIPRAERVVMIGSGLAILGHPTVASSLIHGAAAPVEIYMADPWSPAVETRLIEEELGSVKPPDGRSGLESRLQTLLKLWQDAGRPEKVSIKVFTQYPTFALLIIGDDYFVYPYAYATLGNFSPVIRFSRSLPEHRDIIAFLDNHYARVKADSWDAEQVLNARLWSFPNVDQLHALALFLIPSEDSALYRFGSDVIGYDVRRQRIGSSPWPEEVGAAASYGFHLTVCDALYFPSESELQKVVSEVEYVSTGFGVMTLDALTPRGRFPSGSAIALSALDESGQIEALHCELVQRVYRRAIASDYTFGLARADRDNLDRRSEFMLRRYKAPYVLTRFQPHFTLLSNVSSERQDELMAELSRSFEARVRNRAVHIGRLAVMTKRADHLDGRWTILKEIPLRSA
jgi:hypothetical protein